VRFTFQIHRDLEILTPSLAPESRISFSAGCVDALSKSSIGRGTSLASLGPDPPVVHGTGIDAPAGG
jgi:hypothetical protein